MNVRINKVFNDLPVSLKILCGFLLVCCALTAASGIVYYRYSKTVVEDSIRRQASALCEHVEREFTMRFASPVTHELGILVTSPQLNNYLMSSKEEMLIHRAEVEQLFLSVSHGRDIYRSTTFLDPSGHERIGTSGNTRRRIFRSLTQMADEGSWGRNMNEVFLRLKSSQAPSLCCSDLFYDAQNRLGVFVGLAKQEPEAGGFGGVVVQHCDLTAFVREVSQHRILSTAVVWVYGREGEILFSPPAGEVQLDPGLDPATAEGALAGYVYTAQCRFLPGDRPTLTVVCSIPPRILSKQLGPVIRSVVMIFSVLLAGSLASSFLISRWISRRIRKLTEAAQNVSAQRLDIGLAAGLAESRDEIGVLANTFRKMLLDLKESTTSIDNLNGEIAQRRQAQEALRRERDRAQGYLDVADVLLLALNEHGQVTLINRTGSRILGYEEQELLGKDWIETCLPPRARPGVQQAFRSLMEGQLDLVKYVENPVLTRSGEERLLAWHNTILKDDAGRIIGTLSSGEDITDRKRAAEALQKSEEQYRSLFENMLNGFACCEMLFENGRPQDFIYRKVNGAFGRLTGLHDVVGKRVTEVLPGLKASNPELFEIYGRVASTGRPESVEAYLPTVGWLSISAHSPQQGHFVAVFENITERKQAEEQQTKLLQRLSEINQELKDFAYVVSHDLKAPLRAIRALADWLCADYQDKLDDQGRENLRLLSGRVDRMHNLIDGVLQYSRIGRAEQATVAVDLHRLVPEIIDDLGAPAHIAIRVESDLPTIQTDVTKITQVFQNLLSNAIKYMDKPQGRITVDCVPDGGFWEFRVADNGPGIERKDFERIFKLFQTLAPRDDSESTGVGLTVTKKIVEMYGGRIWIESEVGKGSTFFFTFPRRNEAVLPECLAAGVGMGHGDIMEVEN